MADRFAESNDILIESLKDNVKKKKKKKNNKVQKTGLKFGRLGQHQRAMKKILKATYRGALNKILEDFYATVRKRDGEDDEPDSFHVMLTTIDWHLTGKGTTIL